ncbi:methionine ABC transporter ATP-binding protein [Sneathia vaginalis]|uniref:methionine ABC transporter ATP-binding protein n=1 Tax=Sneathia vaginalis TaxID=187101 RepID=UPI0035C6859A
MIEFKNVSKKYGDVEVLKDISLKIEKDDIFGIVGLSGAGKSTLIRTINRLEDIDSGELTVDGKVVKDLSVKDLRKFRKEISMVFQNFNLLESRTVYENVKLPLELVGNVDKQKIERVLELVELYDKKDEYIKKLSGGQKQRVAIARALITNPKIILSDEATSALDPLTANNILELLQRINKKFGITIVVITHQMEVIKKICNKIAVIKEGHIIEKGQTDVIFTNPENEFTKKLIGGIKND